MSDYGPPQPPDAGGPHDPHQPYQGQPYQGQPPPGQPYPGQPYPGQPYPGPPAAAPRQSPFTGLGNRIGERLVRRPEPRFTVGLAGAGMGMLLFGIVLWAGSYWSHGLSNGLSTDRNLLGAGLAALVVLIGYFLAVRVRRGPLGTAGVIGIGVGWPLALGFATLDLTNRPLPLNFDAIFWVSVVAWLITYLWVPGARGHTFFLFLVAQGFFAYVLIKNISTSSFGIASSGTGFVPTFSGVGTVAAISFFFGVGYYVIAFVLDRRGKHGPATALLYSAFIGILGGIIAWAPDIHASGAGVLGVVTGLAVCWYGGRYGRRITCFLGAAGIAAGVFALLADATNDATTAGVSFVAIGVIAVFLAFAISMATGEPHDMDPQAVVRSR